MKSLSERIMARIIEFHGPNARSPQVEASIMTVLDEFQKETEERFRQIERDARKQAAVMGVNRG